MEDRSNHLLLSLASLIHEIGKVGLRAYHSKAGISNATDELLTNVLSRSYPKSDPYDFKPYSAEFCHRLKNSLPDEFDFDSLLHLTLFSEDAQSELKNSIIEAKRISSVWDSDPEDTIEKRAEKSNYRLASILSRIKLNGTSGDQNNYFYKLKEYDPHNMFPESIREFSYSENAYKDIWDRLCDTIQMIELNNGLKFINTLLSILERYLWSIPEIVGEVACDTSLIDKLKITSSLAVSSSMAENKEMPFLLVSGEFGGIQNFIFNLKSGSGGLAKALRGRSFSVSLISDTAAMSILHSLELPLTHLIMNAGGHFHLVLPNNANSIMALKNHRENMHKWILEKFNGELRFNLAWHEASSANLQHNISDAMSQLGYKLNEIKLSGLSPLTNNGEWNLEEWIRPEYSDINQNICRSCRTHPAITEEGYCELCKQDRDIGRELPKSDLIENIFEKGFKFNTPFSSFDLKSSYKSENLDSSADIIIACRGNARIPFKHSYSMVLKNNHVPILTEEDIEESADSEQRSGNVMEFETIAKKAEGANYLGYLKADIDNLGFTFMKGFELNGLKPSISRYASLSRSLEYFFSGYLYALLESKYKYVYTVFSGGDDLAFIGPWDNIIDLAQNIKQDFDRFTGNNQSWGISAGISLARSKTPISNVMKITESNLKSSKDEPQKDSITVFSTTMSWQDYNETLAEAKKIANWIKDGVINTSQIFRMLNYGLELRRYEEDSNTMHLKAIPQMIYDLNRNWSTEEGDEKKARLWADSYADINNSKNIFLPFICQYALLKNRGSDIL